MDAQLKQKWVEALRSGDYEQTTGSLTNDKGAFCCLGVLCVISGVEVVGNDCIVDGKDAGYEPINKMVGIGNGVNLYDLWERNDGDGKAHKQHSFVEMADYIEANIPSDAGAA